MFTLSVSARSAPGLTESSTTRRSTAAADQILAGVPPAALFSRTPREPLLRGTYLRMAVLRFRLAYFIVAVLRSTTLRRVVEHFLALHHEVFGESGSSLHPGLNSVRPRPADCGRWVLTRGPRRLLMSSQAPHLWCVALKNRGNERRIRGLTYRSTSTQGQGWHGDGGSDAPNRLTLDSSVASAD